MFNTTWWKIGNGPFELPEPNRPVAVCHVVNGYPSWVTKGHLTKGGTWSLKMTVGLSFASSHPTHWAYLPECNYVIGEKKT